MDKFRREVSLPQIGLIAITRFALGLGVGLLLADKLAKERRQGAAIALVAIGAITTAPLIADVFCERH